MCELCTLGRTRDILWQWNDNFLKLFFSFSERYQEICSFMLWVFSEEGDLFQGQWLSFIWLIFIKCFLCTRHYSRHWRCNIEQNKISNPCVALMSRNTGVLFNNKGASPEGPRIRIPCPTMYFPFLSENLPLLYFRYQESILVDYLSGFSHCFTPELHFTESSVVN